MFTLCSNYDAMCAKRSKHEDMFQYMQVIITGDMVEKGKPNPDIFLLAAKSLNADPKYCLAFEDSLAGVQSASAAGMKCIALPDSRLDHTAFRQVPGSKICKSLLHCFESMRQNIDIDSL